MARLEDIRGLAEAHASSISSSPRDWMNYLDTAARLYRYPFMDQLLIHAQRPQATACASLELWNQKMFRWVNRGAKGIALIDETTQKTRLRYVFDVQDTHMVNGGRTPYLWKLQEEQQEEVLLHLEEVYGLEAKDTKNLSDALMATARYMVEENLEEYLDGLLYVTEGTYLEELEEDTIRSEFRSLLTDSIYYTLASRCGLDPMERQEEMDFVHITDHGVPIIPGSSLAGALRHRIVTILLDMKMAGIKLPENINELVDIVFGYVHGDNACASNIIIGETEIKNTRPLTMVRTGVSRFESAVKQGTLYKEKTYVDGNLNVHIMVRKSEHPADEKWILGLLLLAIKDLQNGLLAVGGQTAIGRGIFEKQGPIVIDGKEGIEDAVIGELLKNMAEKGEVC